mgnify:FL=1
MNAYTLDPTKPTNDTTAPAVAAAVASPPPQASAPSVNYAPVPYYVPPNYQYYAYQHPQLAPAPVQQPTAEIKGIRDWLPWSIINLFIGGIILGIIPLIFSLICRSKKSANDAKSARTMSVLALVFNIFITIFGIITFVSALIYILVVLPQVQSQSYHTLY